MPLVRGIVMVVDEGKLSSLLREFARTLVNDFPIQQILDRLVERIVDVLPVTSVGMTLIDEDGEPHYVAASDASALHYECLQMRMGQGPCLAAFDSGEPAALTDPGGDEPFPAFTAAAQAAGLGAVFAFPLHYGEQRLGALTLYRERSGELDRHAMETAQLLADVAAAYLVNAKARDEVALVLEQHRHQALHDVLTGLANRALLQDRLQHAAQRAARTSGSTAVLFIDLDDFKLVNDTHGHHVGDELLVAVARRLETLVRAGDTLARVSGDEFVILCENLTDRSDVDLVKRRVREAFEVPFDLSEVELTLTASVGIAVAGPGEAITDRLLVEADAAMYTAKRVGWGAHLLGRHGPFDLDGRDLPTREERLARAFVDLADTLVATFDVDDYLGLLCERMEEVLEVDAVGVMLESPEGVLRLWSASTEAGDAVELFEMQEREGPCYDAYLHGEQILAPDITDLDRWPAFTPRALGAGFTAVFGFPMRVRDARIGAVNVFRFTPGDLDARDRSAGQALADVATLALLAQRRTEDARTLAEQLQYALETRLLIEQAKGALAERCGITTRDAWERMRRHARREQRPVRTLCPAIIDGDLTP